jgi:hypothetical protein
MDQDLQQQRDQPSPIQVDKVPVEVTTQTEELGILIKVTIQVIVTTYADGSKKQTRHQHTDTRVTFDRDDVTDSYEDPI